VQIEATSLNILWRECLNYLVGEIFSINGWKGGTSEGSGTINTNICDTYVQNSESICNGITNAIG
jgi:hypothetical protein